MGYDRGDSFEPNRIPFGSKSEVKLSPRLHPIQCERKWKSSLLSEDLRTPKNICSAYIVLGFLLDCRLIELIPKKHFVC